MITILARCIGILSIDNIINTNIVRQVNRPKAMRKDAIQTRKRKPKNPTKTAKTETNCKYNNSCYVTQFTNIFN